MPRIVRRFFLRNPTRASYKFVLREWRRLPELESLGRALETKWFSQQLQPVVMERPDAERILVLAPHPDDDILGAGGTLIRSRAGGAAVTVAYVTSAANPTYRDAQRNTLVSDAARIEEEARAVAAQLGTSAEFWRFDKRAIPLEPAAARLRATVACVRPDALFLPFFTDDHPDHRRVSEILATAYRSVAPPRAEVWAYQVYSTVLTNVVVDITDVMEEKLALLALWQSQRRSRDWGHYIRGLNACNARFLPTNAARYAETFFVLPIADYLDLCQTYFQ